MLSYMLLPWFTERIIQILIPHRPIDEQNEVSFRENN